MEHKTDCRFSTISISWLRTVQFRKVMYCVTCFTDSKWRSWGPWPKTSDFKTYLFHTFPLPSWDSEMPSRINYTVTFTQCLWKKYIPSVLCNLTFLSLHSPPSSVIQATGYRWVESTVKDRKHALHMVFSLTEHWFVCCSILLSMNV